MTDEPSWVPPGVDTKRANVARVYDYLLGGSHNFLADQDAGRALVAVEPYAREMARANRAFLGRADGFELLDPGLVQSPFWRPDSPADLPDDPSRFCGLLVGVGRKA